MFRTTFKKFTQTWFGVQNKQQALRMKHRISILYAFFGWNCFGIAFYVMMKNKIPTEDTERRMSYRNLTGVPDNVHVYRMSGMTLSEDFEISYKAKVAQMEKEAAEKEKVIAEEEIIAEKKAIDNVSN